jgi:predicted GIY-YIG superfamily endonuclease
MSSYIYEIVCNITNERYIGSSHNIRHREWCHKTNKREDNKSYQITSRGNYSFKILEELGEITKEEQLLKEQEYIDKLDCINERKAVRTNEDLKEYFKKYNKEYYHKNKDERKELKKQIDKEYYQANKDRLGQKNSCECGGIYTTAGKSRHFKTELHKNFINLNKIPENFK